MSCKDAETAVRFSPVANSRTADYLADFPNYDEGLVRGDPGGFVLTRKYADTVDDYLNFPVQDEDVWVVTFPKSGNFQIITFIIHKVRVLTFIKYILLEIRWMIRLWWNDVTLF